MILQENKTYWIRLLHLLQKNVQAYSLIELSAMLTIAGIVAAGYLAMNMAGTSSHAKKAKITIERMNMIMQVLKSYQIEHKQLPEPLLPDDVPVNKLQLPLEYKLDGWGNKFGYHISNEGKLTVTDHNLTPKTTSAAFILVSYGGKHKPDFPPTEFIQTQATKLYSPLLMFASIKQLAAYVPVQNLVSFTDCEANSNKIKTTTHAISTTNTSYYEQALAVMWTLQDACYQYYPQTLQRACPNNVPYDPNSHDPCSCNNGKWDGPC
jgi:type II secretory pathway pseudopilin PulG